MSIENNNKNISKDHISNKKYNVSKDSNDNIIEEMKPKLKRLNKFFKLEELKHQEKICRQQNEFIDPIEKPKFLFMRKDSKNIIAEYKPATIFCDKNRIKYSTLDKKYLDINGFRNFNSGKKIETETCPNTFEDIITELETKDTKYNLNLNRHLLNDRYLYVSENKLYKNYNIKTETSETDERIKNRIIKKNISSDSFKKKINLLKTKKNKNHTFSSLGKRNKEFIKTISSDDKKRKRPTTSRYGRKYYLSTPNENNIDNYNDNKKNEKDFLTLEIQRKHSSSKKNMKYNLNMNNSNNTYKNRNSSVNKSYKSLSNYTTTLKSNSKSVLKQDKNNNIFRSIEKQVLNPDTFFITKNDYFTENLDNNEFKTTRQLINRIINDGNIIDNYIRNDGMDNEKFYKVDKEKILLKLADRIRKNKLKKNKSKMGRRRKLNDEEIFIGKLSKIKSKVVKKYFRDVFRQMLFEKRTLNKDDKNILVERLEDQQGRKRRNMEIKKQAIQQMKYTQDNVITEKDDQKLLYDIKKTFMNYYGTLDGLEWLINKRHVITFGNRWVGAFNPYRKSKFQINYEEDL